MKIKKRLILAAAIAASISALGTPAFALKSIRETPPKSAENAAENAAENLPQPFEETSDDRLSLERIYNSTLKSRQNNLFERISQWIDDAQKVVSEIGNSLKEKLGEIAQIWGGEGLPDPNSLDKKIEQNAASSEIVQSAERAGSNAGNGSFVTNQDVATDLTGNIGKSVASGTTLSQEAQEKTQQRAAAIAKATSKSLSLAEDSQNQDVTQNIERNQSEQLSILAEQQAATLAELQATRYNAAMSAQLQAEALEELQSKNIGDRNQKAATARTSINASQFSVFGDFEPGTGTEENSSNSLGNFERGRDIRTRNRSPKIEPEE